MLNLFYNFRYDLISHAPHERECLAVIPFRKARIIRGSDIRSGFESEGGKIAIVIANFQASAQEPGDQKIKMEAEHSVSE